MKSKWRRAAVSVTGYSRMAPGVSGTGMRASLNFGTLYSLTGSNDDKDLRLPDDDPRHGTPAGRTAGCYCEDCVEARRVYMQERARLKKEQEAQSENTNHD